jgi:hypothetical protein
MLTSDGSNFFLHAVPEKQSFNLSILLCAVLPDEFNVYTHEAGAGVLSIGIDGPSKATIDVVDRGTGFVTVSYSVQAAGEHTKCYSTKVTCFVLNASLRL